MTAINDRHKLTALHDGTVPPGTRLLWMLLVDDCEIHARDYSTIGQPDLARKLGVSTDSLIRWTKKLVEMGVLRTERQRYGLHWFPLPYIAQ